jgi:hypothetical protein
MFASVKSTYRVININYDIRYPPFGIVFYSYMRYRTCSKTAALVLERLLTTFLIGLTVPQATHNDAFA